MIPPDAADSSGGSGSPPPLPPAAGAAPPPLPRASVSRSGTSRSLVIAMCICGFALFMGLTLAGVAMFLRSQGPTRGHVPVRNQTPARGQPVRREASRTVVADARNTDSMAAPSTQPKAIKSEPGFSYMNDRVRNVPWSVHVIQVDRSHKDLAFFSAHAQGRVLGVSMLADQAAAIPREMGRAVAGVNGDFYERDNRLYAGDPRGLQIINRELISAPNTVCVWFDTEGNPHLDEVKGDFKVTWPDGSSTPLGLNQRRMPEMAVLYTPTYGPATRSAGGRELILEKEGDGAWLPLAAGQTYRARIREVNAEGNTPLTAGIMVLSVGPQVKVPETAAGTAVTISTATTPELKAVNAAIAGGPALIEKGVLFAQATPPAGSANAWSERSKYERHPRSAIGWNDKHVFLVTVDGRQPDLSVGMKLAELAEYMSKLGCTEAMNLDGGKSAQMWLSGRIVNSPCQGEDTVANSLMVLRKPQGGAARNN